ncbi:MAG: primosomal protein N', partial [Myxococcota bacterium]
MTTPSSTPPSPPANTAPSASLFGELFSEKSLLAVRVGLPVPVDTLFTYRVPAALAADAQPGHRVLVPFSGRHLTGVVMERVEPGAQHTDLAEESPAGLETADLEEIAHVLDATPVLSDVMRSLLSEAAREALCPVGLALAAALPSGSAPRSVRQWALTPRGQEALRSGVLRGPARDVLEALIEGPMDPARLGRRVPGASDEVESLLGDGFLRRVDAWREPSVRVSRERVARVAPETDVEAVCAGDLARAPKQAALLRQLDGLGELRTADLAARTGGRPAQLRALVSRGLVETFLREAPRNVLGTAVPRDRPLELTEDQAAALAPLEAAIDAREGRHFLLHGVTGSGKTEIYLRAVARALDAGRQALILVPEISLTHQIVARLRARFGDDLAVLHSGLRPSERLEQWQRLRAGRTPIAVGARSALFAPLTDPGVIVIDEEHDSAYKNEEGFRYRAGWLAGRLAERMGCPLVLGSATPGLETRYRADQGEIERLVLPRRIAGRPLPHVDIVDMEAERNRTARGRTLILSKPLRRAIAETLEAKAQTILFLNRRGFSTRIFCFDCGHAEHCLNCDVALVYHATEHTLRCHYCEFRKPPPSQCGGCGRPDTALLGTGTQRVEEEIRALFHDARTARLDRDTASRRGHVEAVLDGLRAGDIDIVIGTQMVAKGHDFPGVRLVGVIAADLGLHMPDFRASERCFQ